MLETLEVINEINDTKRQYLRPYVKKYLEPALCEEEEGVQYYICPFCNIPAFKVRQGRASCEHCRREYTLLDIASKVEGVDLRSEERAEEVSKELALLRDIKKRIDSETALPEAPQEPKPKEPTPEPTAEQTTEEQAPPSEQEAREPEATTSETDTAQEPSLPADAPKSLSKEAEELGPIIQELMQTQFRELSMYQSQLSFDTAIQNITYTPTGFTHLDKALGGGLTPGLVTLGAQSSVGKTSLALQIATNIASTGRKVIFFSLEMSQYELLAKIKSRYSYIYSNKIAKNALTTQGVYVKSNQSKWSRQQAEIYKKIEGDMTAGSLTKMLARMFVVEEAPPKIIWEPAAYVPATETEPAHTEPGHQKEIAVPIGIDTIEQKLTLYESIFKDSENNSNPITRAQAEIGQEPGQEYSEDKEPLPFMPVVFVDYAQILAPADPRASDKQNIDTAVRELKKLSRRFNTTIFLLSAFNRQSNNKSADMDSFRESSSLEYGSDILLALQPKYVSETERQSKAKNKAVMDKMKSQPEREVELKILKNRNGRTNISETLTYIAPFNYFAESPKGFLITSNDEQTPF